MFTYSAKSFEELALPLSRNKVFLLVEILDPFKADGIDYYHLIMNGLGLDVSGSGTVGESIARGYLVAETEISDRNRNSALSVIDYFRRANVKDIARAYLFINEELVEHSSDGMPSMFDLVEELPSACYRFK